MRIYDQLTEALSGRENELLSRQEIQRLMKVLYNRNPNSVIPSDYCYNRSNKGISFTQHLFEYMTRSQYKYIGENAPYTGLIYRKGKCDETEDIIGEWTNGKKIMYAAENAGFISKEQLVELYEEYLRIFRYELQVLQCQPTELRHLIGRIGELFCAIETNGQLARETNQHGFDVVSSGRRISVKTTAQKAGFITFNQKTFDQLDTVFIVQYRDDDFHVLYFGDKEPVERIARSYGSAYEVDIEKVKRIK